MSIMDSQNGQQQYSHVYGFQKSQNPHNSSRNMDVSLSQNFLAAEVNDHVPYASHNRSVSKDSSLPISQMGRLRSEKNMIGENKNPLSIKPEFKFGQARPYKPSQNLTTRADANSHIFKSESSRGRVEDYISSFKSKLSNNSFLQTGRDQKISANQTITVNKDFTEIQIPLSANQNQSYQMNQGSNPGSFLNNSSRFNQQQSTNQITSPHANVYSQNLIQSNRSPEKKGVSKPTPHPQSSILNSLVFAQEPSNHQISVGSNSQPYSAKNSITNSQSLMYHNFLNSGNVNSSHNHSLQQQMNSPTSYYSKELTKGLGNHSVNRISQSKFAQFGNKENPLTRKLIQTDFQA